MSTQPLNTTTKQYTTTHFRVMHAPDSQYSGSYSPEGYSKYYERYDMYNRGEIPYGDIYGLQQAMEHARELKEYKWGNDRYSESYRNSNYVVVKTVSIIEETIIPYIHNED